MRLEETFLNSWRLRLSPRPSSTSKWTNYIKKERRRGFQAPWSHWMKTFNSEEQRLQCPAWTTFLFPYLRLVPLTNSFLCCSWQHVALHTLPRLCRLNDTLLPVSPRLPQGTTTHTGQNEGNGFDFLPLFTHQMETRTRSTCWSWPSWINKLTPRCVCVCVWVCLDACVFVLFKLCLCACLCESVCVLDTI